MVANEEQEQIGQRMSACLIGNGLKNENFSETMVMRDMRHRSQCSEVLVALASSVCRPATCEIAKAAW